MKFKKAFKLLFGDKKAEPLEIIHSPHELKIFKKHNHLLTFQRINRLELDLEKEQNRELKIEIELLENKILKLKEDAKKENKEKSQKYSSLYQKYVQLVPKIQTEVNKNKSFSNTIKTLETQIEISCDKYINLENKLETITKEKDLYKNENHFYKENEVKREEYWKEKIDQDEKRLLKKYSLLPDLATSLWDLRVQLKSADKFWSLLIVQMKNYWSYSDFLVKEIKLAKQFTEFQFKNSEEIDKKLNKIFPKALDKINDLSIKCDELKSFINQFSKMNSEIEKINESNKVLIVNAKLLSKNTELEIIINELKENCFALDKIFQPAHAMPIAFSHWENKANKFLSEFKDLVCILEQNVTNDNYPEKVSKMNELQELLEHFEKQIKKWPVMIQNSERLKSLFFHSRKEVSGLSLELEVGPLKDTRENLNSARKHVSKYLKRVSN